MILSRDSEMNTDIPQVHQPDVKSDMHTPPAFPFLKLPQELRDKVYENLLCPHIDGTLHRRNERIRDYGLEPSILRTCKQVCQEGSRVLYTKNGTVLIRMAPLAIRIFIVDGSTTSFSDSYPFARVKCGRIGGTPVVTMEMSLLAQYKARLSKHLETERKIERREKGKEESLAEGQDLCFIGFMPALSKICRLITRTGFGEKMKLVIHVERSIRRSPESRLQMLLDSLESFREARGLGHAVIFTEPQHSAIAAEVADLMMTPIQAFDECFSIACAYEARILRQLKEKRWNDAQATLQNALDFFHSRHLTYGLRGMTIEKRHEFEVKMINTQWNYVSCCLKVGRTGDAMYEIREMFQTHTPEDRSQARQEGYWDRIVDAHYAIGEAFTIDGFLNSAVLSFEQVLLAAPGHVKAEKAIADLEERVKFSSKPGDVTAKLNIERIQRELRHPVPGQHRLTDDQKNNLFKYRSFCYNTEATSVDTLGALASKIWDKCRWVDLKINDIPTFVDGRRQRAR